MRKIALAEGELQALFGVHDENLRHLESDLDIKVSARDREVFLEGDDDGVEIVLTPHRHNIAPRHSEIAESTDRAAHAFLDLTKRPGPGRGNEEGIGGRPFGARHQPIAHLLHHAVEYRRLARR